MPLLRSVAAAVAAGAVVAAGQKAFLSPSERRLQQSTSCLALERPAHQEPIRNDDVETQMSYLRSGSGAPEVFEGIYWLDMTGYYQTRADRPSQMGEYEVVPGVESWYKTFPHNWPHTTLELAISFGAFQYDNATRCMKVPMRTDAFLWANSTGGAAGSPEWDDLADKAYLQHCFDESMTRIKIYYQMCGPNGTGSDNKEDWLDSGEWVIPRPWGLERMTEKPGQTVLTHYALYRIVDGRGQRTQHYQAWLDFMRDPCWLGFFSEPMKKNIPYWNSDAECISRGGWQVNLGDGYSVIGRPGAA